MPLVQTFALLATINQCNSYDSKGKPKHLMDHNEKAIAKKLDKLVKDKQNELNR